MIINFGSLNIDKVYGVKDIVKEGETIFASTLETFTGGKGLNQSVAAARSGGSVLHAGSVGPDGAWLEDYLKESGVDVSRMNHTEVSTGHAIIQVNEKGQNSIIVFGGANQELTRSYIDSILDATEKGDFVLLQNETNEIPYILSEAHRRGLQTVWNPSPFPEKIASYPTEDVDYFIVNEMEGAALAGGMGASYEETLAKMVEKYPNATIVMTLGGDGSLCYHEGRTYFQPIYQVSAVDTTAAGDTFCGYFLSLLSGGKPIEECLR
ncbi:MAG: ribokinase, partial [Spirochaetales bacterium]|nr:ribokinase [Candidatus Physcosoma equi]